MITMNARHATDLLLRSIYLYEGRNRRAHNFMYGKPGSRPFMGQSGIEIHYEHGAFLDAALFLRRNAAPHLRSLSVQELGNRITKFVVGAFWTISDEAWMLRENRSLSEVLSDQAKLAFATAMDGSTLFVEPHDLTLFPMTAIVALSTFEAPSFFITPHSDLTPERLNIKVRENEFRPDLFPPFDGQNYGSGPKTWLGVWAADADAADRQRAAILGAMSLLLSAQRRYLFSGRRVAGGRCTIANSSYTHSMTAPHTPGLFHDLVLNDEDRDWLTALGEKLVSPTKVDRREMRALEYLYRAWAPGPERRFPTLFASLDAIVGEVGRATDAVVVAVAPVMGAEYDETRLRLLLSLRGSVVHGGAPNVYESTKYHQYYERYRTDAIDDLEKIIGVCLRAMIFGEKLTERE